MKSGNSGNYNGFTIVELLVVIVVIGILATLTIVSYNGVTQKAVASALQSDLTNAKTQLNMFQVDNLAYPTTISTDCDASPTSTTAPTNLCLKVSSNNTYSNYIPSNTSNPPTFSLTASNPSLSYSYIVTNSSKPTSLAPAPLSPVADWLALPQGDHYGNFYDLVTKTDATVTRTTPKTIYDPTTQKIYDVPANKLGIRPRSDGKSGFEAEVEEARTNQVLNSSFESDTNSDGVANNFTLNGSGGTYSLDQSSAIYGSKSQKITKYSASTDVISQSLSLAVTAGETYTYSVWVKGENVSGGQTGSDFGIYVDAVGGTDPAEYGISVAAPVGTFGWRRISVTKTFTYSHTTQSIYPIFRNKSGTIWWDNFQVEKGSAVSSYIPTTTSSASRNRDAISIMTTNWNYLSGTLFSSGIISSTAYVLESPATSTTKNRIVFYRNTNSAAIYDTGADGVASESSKATMTSNYTTMAGSYGSQLKAYLDGVAGNAVAQDQNDSISSTASIGSSPTGTWHINGPLQRLLVYNSSLSDSDVVIVTNFIKDGP